MTHFSDIVSADEAQSLAVCKAALARDAVLARLTGRVSAARRLPGLTNRVYRLDAERGAFVLRLPRAETVWAIDRHAELRDLRAAARLGVAVAPLHGDPEAGVLLFPAVEATGAVTPAALGTCLGRLHGGGIAFSAARDLGAYFGACEARIAGVSDLEALAAPLAAATRDLLRRMPPGPAVACHFDPSPGNLIPTAAGVLLIDFEYAAMAPAAWDLAYAALENGFDPVEETRFLAAYEAARGGASLVAGRTEIEAYKVVCDAVSMLWALGQVRAGNDATDFLASARGYRARALDRLGRLASP